MLNKVIISLPILGIYSKPTEEVTSHQSKLSDACQAHIDEAGSFFSAQAVQDWVYKWANDSNEKDFDNHFKNIKNFDESNSDGHYSVNEMIKDFTQEHLACRDNLPIEMGLTNLLQNNHIYTYFEAERNMFSSLVSEDADELENALELADMTEISAVDIDIGDKEWENMMAEDHYSQEDIKDLRDTLIARVGEWREWSEGVPEETTQAPDDNSNFNEGTETPAETTKAPEEAPETTPEPVEETTKHVEINNGGINIGGFGGSDDGDDDYTAQSIHDDTPDGSSRIMFGSIASGLVCLFYAVM